jgi:hypothetical protein
MVPFLLYTQGLASCGGSLLATLRGRKSACERIENNHEAYREPATSESSGSPPSHTGVAKETSEAVFCV